MRSRARRGEIIRVILASAWLLGLACAALAARWIGDAGDGSLLAPGPHHWLGTDLLGRDVLLRLAEGGLRTIGIAGSACLISVLAGGAWGITAGFFQGTAARILHRLIDVGLAVPSLLLALTLLAALGPGEVAVALAVGVGGAATFARLARAEALQVREKEYVIAARLVGADEAAIIRRHLLPNVASSLIAYAVLQFSWALANAASLTFLGFGGSLTAPEWGRMLGEARLVFWQAPWQALAVGTAVALSVLAAQALGESREGAA
jgi:peptide/nickel transport system permease protein